MSAKHVVPAADKDVVEVTVESGRTFTSSQFIPAVTLPAALLRERARARGSECHHIHSSIKSCTNAPCKQKCSNMLTDPRLFSLFLPASSVPVVTVVMDNLQNFLPLRYYNDTYVHLPTV